MEGKFHPAGLEVKSAIHRETMEPYIFINSDKEQWRMTPEQATSLGLALIEAAAIGCQEGLLVRFLSTEVRMSEEALAHTLRAFHTWKSERREAHEADQRRRSEEMRRMQEGN
jgi:hypothetical protein